MKHFLLIFLGLFIASCHLKNSGPSYKRPGYDMKDSILIAVALQDALQHPEKKDSLINVASKSVKGNSTLIDIFHYGLSKLYIQTGKLAGADSIAKLGLKNIGLDSLNFNAGKYYNLLGSVHALKNEQEAAITNFSNAIKIFEHANDLKQVAAIQCNLANLFMGRLEYEKAYEYSLKASEKLKKLNDTLYLPICQGLLAVTSNKTGKNEVAKKYAAEGLAISKKYHNSMGIVFAQYAHAQIDLESGHPLEAIAQLDSALALAGKIHNFQLILAIKASLVTGNLHLKNYKEAISNGEEALQIAEAMGHSEIQYNLNKNLAKSYAGLGNFKKAFPLMEKAERIYSKKSNAKNQKIIQELLLKYEAKKKDNQILLQQKNLTRQRTWIFGLIVFLGMSILGLFAYRSYTMQQNKIKMHEKENAIQMAISNGEEKERLRLAGELHDGMASNLVALKVKLEDAKYKDDAGHQQMLLLLQQVHKEVRSIAHNLSPIDFTVVPVQNAIENFCQSISTPTLPVTFYTNSKENLLKNTSSLIVYRTVQECIQNAVKHAEATTINAQCLINAEKQKVMITIEDNGKGFELDGKMQTAFLNLKKRIQQIGGELEIESQPGVGTSLFIHI